MGYIAVAPGHVVSEAEVQKVDPCRPTPMIVWQQMPPLQSAASLHAIVCVLQPAFGALQVSVEPPSVRV
jgi:hypothetical protein